MLGKWTVIVSVSSIASHGWHHYTPSPRVRGCTEIETLECVQIWPDGTLTTSDSITVLWTLPDQYDTEFKVGQQLTIKHDENLAQFGSINANVEDHNLDSMDRSFSPIEVMIPGVLYQFQLMLVDPVNFFSLEWFQSSACRGNIHLKVLKYQISPVPDTSVSEILGFNARFKKLENMRFRLRLCVSAKVTSNFWRFWNC